MQFGQNHLGHETISRQLVQIDPNTQLSNKILASQAINDIKSTNGYILVRLIAGKLTRPFVSSSFLEHKESHQKAAILYLNINNLGSAKENLEALLFSLVNLQINILTNPEDSFVQRKEFTQTFDFSSI